MYWKRSSPIARVASKWNLRTFARIVASPLDWIREICATKTNIGTTRVLFVTNATNHSSTNRSVPSPITSTVPTVTRPISQHVAMVATIPSEQVNIQISFQASPHLLSIADNRSIFAIKPLLMIICFIHYSSPHFASIASIDRHSVASINRFEENGIQGSPVARQLLLLLCV